MWSSGLERVGNWCRRPPAHLPDLQEHHQMQNDEDRHAEAGKDVERPDIHRRAGHPAFLTQSVSSMSLRGTKLGRSTSALMGPESAFVALKKVALGRGRGATQTVIPVWESIKAFDDVQVTPCGLLDEVKDLFVTE